ncbi:Alpha/Beta hydrolase protein [Globomyces pollinis-pini]|nr:Alpha/Beta hydrolase protein [Globomyces pollinis-pini]
MSVYKQFLDKPERSSNFQIASRLFTSVVPSLGYSLTSYWTNGPAHPSWSYTYHVTMNTLRGVLIGMQQGELPNVHEIQNSTSNATNVPKDTVVKEEPFVVNPEVIEFIKENGPGEWPDHAADSQHSVYGEWVIPPDVDSGYVFYLLHGGAYILGSAPQERRNAYTYSKASKTPIFSISYRLAPQNPYPCGLIDAVSGYLHLLKSYDPSKIIIGGDSAGGGLTIATLMVIRDMQKPLPAGGLGMSPWLELTQSRPSYTENAKYDYLPDLAKDPRLGDRIHYYAPNDQLKHPYVSPYWADNLDNLPPLLIQVGGVERLYDEIIEFSLRTARTLTTPVTLEVYDAHTHVFQMFQFQKGSQMAVKRLGDWVQAITGRTTLESKESARYDYSFHGVMTDHAKY